MLFLKFFLLLILQFTALISLSTADSPTYGYFVQETSPNGSLTLEEAYILWNKYLSVSWNISQAFSESTIIDAYTSTIITLNIQPYRIDTEVFSFYTRAYCYQDVCSVPGPTITITAGETLR